MAIDAELIQLAVLYVSYFGLVLYLLDKTFKQKGGIMKLKGFNFQDGTQVLCLGCSKWISTGYADLDGEAYKAYYCHNCNMNGINETFKKDD